MRTFPADQTFTLSTMDDVYNMELLQQSLIDASERENRLLLALTAAREETEEFKRRAIVSKMRYQELDEALEVEEANTHAERLARQDAEEQIRQHRSDVLKAEKNEDIANKQCNAAEAEILQLQRRLSTERSATVAANILSGQLREDSQLAELDGLEAYKQLHAANEKVCILREELEIATDRISMLERQGREIECQRVDEAEMVFSATTYELENLTDPSKDSDNIGANHNRPGFAKAVVARFGDNGMVHTDQQLRIVPEGGEYPGSKYQQEQPLWTDRGIEDTSDVKATLSTVDDQTMMATEMPALPKPAILRPALAPMTACQVEGFKASGSILPAPRVPLRTPPRKWSLKFRAMTLTLLFQKLGRH